MISLPRKEPAAAFPQESYPHLVTLRVRPCKSTVRWYMYVWGWHRVRFICLVNVKGPGAHQHSMETRHLGLPGTTAAQTRTSHRPPRSHCTQMLQSESELALHTAVLIPNYYTSIQILKGRHAHFFFFSLIKLVLIYKQICVSNTVTWSCKHMGTLTFF